MIGLYNGMFMTFDMIDVNTIVSANINLSGLDFNICGEELLAFRISIVNFFLFTL